VRIEVEVADQAQVGRPSTAGADVIMLDNMDLPAIRAAVAAIAGKALVEVSGNVTTENLENLCQAGVDIISSGALTHSARSVDISMRIEAMLLKTAPPEKDARKSLTGMKHVAESTPLGSPRCVSDVP
jgi:nicotinate-nucleotide pyrophosphorylase (carboxylating)